jgi:hypothetical protein
MKMAAPYRLVALALALSAVACGRSQTGLVQPTPTGETTFLILDGWSQLPVVGAAVTVNGTQAVTDGAGKVRFPASTSNCVVIDVKATGFLDRRTCGSSIAPQITLWPVANADEGEATRNWIFFRDHLDRERWADPFEIALGPELATRADVAQVWRAATDTIQSASRGRIKFQWVTHAPGDVVVEAAVMPLSCSVAPPWPYEIGGFCVTYDPVVYFLDRLRVAPERLADPTTALRALLTKIGISTHTLPGLMNATRPEADFSDFERKTLGMVGIRLRTVTWPDDDSTQ